MSHPNSACGSEVPYLSLDTGVEPEGLEARLGNPSGGPYATRGRVRLGGGDQWHFVHGLSVAQVPNEKKVTIVTWFRVKD